MRICAAILAVLLCSACGGELFRQYEYEEEMYLALDGSAVLYVNSSVAALNALRGTTFDVKPNARVDRAAVTAFFSSPVTEVRSVKESRRANRRFVHVRVDVPDVTTLARAPAFAWSTYRFEQKDGLYVYRQSVGDSANRPVETNWTGNELVAFRMHLPSKVVFHDNGSELRRGNILAWEQTLTDRLRGTPLALETRVETESILYRTLWLFGLTAVAVAVLFVIVIWIIVRRGAATAAV